MTDYNTLGNGFKRGLLGYTEKISDGLAKPMKRFVAEMIYGIAAFKSCKLSEIGRALKEEIPLKKTVDRLGRNLHHFSQNELLTRQYLDTVRPKIGTDTMLVIDGGDATKPCSSKMEAIGSVRDGSTGGFGIGYWTMGVVALSEENHQPIPVYEKLYPCKKEGGLGFNQETKNALAALREHFDADIPRVFDRGFDSGEILNELNAHNEKWIIRANQNRVAVHKGKRTHINDVVRGLNCEQRMIFHTKNGEKTECKIGMTQLTLPRLNNLKLNLIVCKGFGDPLVLYTNLDQTIDTLGVRIVKAYLMRWRIEEFYAFKKQGLGFEDFRVRSLKSIQTLDLLLTIAAGYIGTFCARANSSQFVAALIAASKPIQGVSRFLKKRKFFYYAVSDGIQVVLGSLRCGISSSFISPPKAPFEQLGFAL